jgi:HTH-type transcriptional regulator, sugar sensing transcriptional regulator
MPHNLVDHPDFIATLRAMGLSQYEAQVYLALLGEGAAEVPTVIRKAAIPQNKAYESLVSLERKGFADAVIGDRKRYRAVEPGVAFDRYRRSVEGNLGQAEAAMREIAAATPKAPADAPSISGIQVITAEQVGPMFEEKMTRANTELLVALRAPLTKIGDAGAAREAQASGLNTKWLIERAILEDRKTGAAVREFAVAIGNARVADFVPLRFAVYDRKECIVEMRETDESRFALLVPNAGFAEDLRALFLRLWSEAEPITAKRKRKSAA